MILWIDIWKAADFDRSLFNMTRRQPRFSSWKKTLARCHTTPLCVLFGMHGDSCVLGFEPAGPIVASSGVTAHQTHLKGCRESKLQSCKQQSRTISPWFITHRLFIFNVNRRSVMAAAKKKMTMTGCPVLSEYNNKSISSFSWEFSAFARQNVIKEEWHSDDSIAEMHQRYLRWIKRLCINILPTAETERSPGVYGWAKIDDGSDEWGKSRSPALPVSRKICHCYMFAWRKWSYFAGGLGFFPSLFSSFRCQLQLIVILAVHYFWWGIFNMNLD